MDRHLRIAVADDELDMRDYLQAILPCFGHLVVAVASTGRELVEKCRQERPDLVITDIKMPDMDGIAAASQICKDFPIPVILVSAYHDHDLVERAGEDHILAFLVKPIKQADLEPAIAIATRRFEQFQALRREAADLRQALENRKLIERAKGLLMKLRGPGRERSLSPLAKACQRAQLQAGRGGGHDPDRRGSLSAGRARPGQGPSRPTAPDRLRRPPACLQPCDVDSAAARGPHEGGCGMASLAAAEVT